MSYIWVRGKAPWSKPRVGRMGAMNLDRHSGINLQLW